MAKKPERELHINDDVLELIIFKMLSNDRAFAHSFLSIAKKEIFSNRHIITLFNLHEIYYRKYPNIFKPLTIRGIKSMLRPDEKELLSIVESVDTINIEDYEEAFLINNIDRFVRNRKIDHGAFYIMTQSSKGEDYDLPLFQGMMNEAFNSSLIMDLGLNYFDDIKTRFEDKSLDLHKSVDVGIKALQNNLTDTNGRLAPKTLTIVNGQSNIGKSIILGNMALNAWKTKKNVVIVTCEMSEKAYATRLDAAISKINTAEINDKQDIAIKKIENEARLRRDSGIRIKEFPTGTLSPSMLRSYLTQLKNEFDFDIVIVDYINIMVSDRSTASDNSYSTVKQIAEDLRGVAVIFDVPVVSATQLNRSGYNNGKPGMEHTAESMGVVVTADVIIGIWQEKEDKIAGKLNGVLMKNRYGPNDIFFEMGIDYPTLRLVPEYEKAFAPGQFDKDKKQEIESGSMASGSKSVLALFE